MFCYNDYGDKFYIILDGSVSVLVPRKRDRQDPDQPPDLYSEPTDPRTSTDSQHFLQKKTLVGERRVPAGTNYVSSRASTLMEKLQQSTAVILQEQLSQQS